MFIWGVVLCILSLISIILDSFNEDTQLIMSMIWGGWIFFGGLILTLFRVK